MQIGSYMIQGMRALFIELHQSLGDMRSDHTPSQPAHIRILHDSVNRRTAKKVWTEKTCIQAT